MAVLTRNKQHVFGLINDLQTLQNNIDAEELRAETVEGDITTLTTSNKVDLTQAINSLKSDLDSDISDLDDKLDAEILRAETAEEDLDDKLDAEILRSTTKDTDLDDRLVIIESGLLSGSFWRKSFETLADMNTELSSKEEDTLSGWAYYIKAENDGYVVVPENDGDYIPTGWTEKSLIKFADYTELSGLVNTEKIRAEQAELDLQTELNDTQTGAGLETDGSYLANTLMNYIDTATSLKDADEILDASIKALDDDTYSKSETESLIANGGAEFVTEILTVISDKITLSYVPKNGVILNFGTVRHIDSNFISYDIPIIPTANPSKKEYTLSGDASGQFDDKQVTIQYTYIPSV